MSDIDDILDLDYDSPLESLFYFMCSLELIGASLGTCGFFLYPGKNNSPIWAEFPVIPFLLVMSCIWALGRWLQANYDVRYQLDSRTQQLILIRKIFGQTFKSPVAEFSQLHATGVMSKWSDHGRPSQRTWKYAVCLIANSARMVRVSSYGAFAPSDKAADISKMLGILNFPCQQQSGTLRATLGRDGKVTVGYKPVPRIYKRAGFLDLTIGDVMLLLLPFFIGAMMIAWELWLYW